MNADLLRLAAVLGLLALLLVLQWRFGFRHEMRGRTMFDNLVVALAGSGLLRLLAGAANIELRSRTSPCSLSNRPSATEPAPASSTPR